MEQHTKNCLTQNDNWNTYAAKMKNVIAPMSSKLSCFLFLIQNIPSVQQFLLLFNGTRNAIFSETFIGLSESNAFSSKKSSTFSLNQKKSFYPQYSQSTWYTDGNSPSVLRLHLFTTCVVIFLVINLESHLSQTTCLNCLWTCFLIFHCFL